jgi:hypothetical protein
LSHKRINGWRLLKQCSSLYRQSIVLGSISIPWVSTRARKKWSFSTSHYSVQRDNCLVPCSNNIEFEKGESLSICGWLRVLCGWRCTTGSQKEATRE